MKAEEIRLGNYFLGYDNLPFKWELKHFSFIETDVAIDIDEIIKSPIPLSEDILLKAGFERSSSLSPLWSLGQTMLIWKTEYECDELENYFEFRFGIGDSYKAIRQVRLEYVHELQNLTYILTGKELEINL